MWFPSGFAGCGAALVKDCGTVVWKGGESLGRKRGIEADYAAIVLGMDVCLPGMGSPPASRVNGLTWLEP